MFHSLLIDLWMLRVNAGSILLRLFSNLLSVYIYISKKELAIEYLLRCRQHKSREMKNDLLGVTSKVY